MTSRPDLVDAGFVARWQDLARGASPFLDWAWVGCLATERYTDPVLIEALEAGAVVGMALFNRRRTRLGRTLFLHESGDPAWDAVFIEHNGVLARPGREQAAATAIVAAARASADRVVLSGVNDAGLAAARAAGGMAGPLLTRAAPFRTLLAGDTLDGMSRNTRAQVRRSDRAYAAWGPIRVERAADAAAALEWLERLTAWHADTWTGRGVRSPFVSEAVHRFHREYLVRAERAAMLRVSAGERVIGYLYNLCGGGALAAYQSGFDYAGAPGHGKPGLTSHVAAMGWARAEGFRVYDFLAGDSRYKRSLASGARDLHWTDVRRPVSLAGLEALLRRVLAR